MYNFGILWNINLKKSKINVSKTECTWVPVIYVYRVCRWLQGDEFSRRFARERCQVAWCGQAGAAWLSHESRHAGNQGRHKGNRHQVSTPVGFGLSYCWDSNCEEWKPVVIGLSHLWLKLWRVKTCSHWFVTPLRLKLSIVKTCSHWFVTPLRFKLFYHSEVNSENL